ncbi:hypothetical protein WMY93_026344 [Mugilogobius chulae]|uniref:Uncharacterized protein n=1 Tax=Mugilogobius chulae TaxID=88201 RepID=A0AAW0N774_9GOBI
MCVSEMKTIGGVEMVLGLLDLSLGLILQQIPTSFQRIMAPVYSTAATTCFAGLLLVLDGCEPTYKNIRYNTILHLLVVLFNAGTFGLLIQHVPFKLREIPDPNGGWIYLDRHATLLIGGVLVVLVVSLLVETLVGLYLALIGWCVMTEMRGQTEIPEGNTTEPLCVELNPDCAGTEAGLNQDCAGTEPGLNQDCAEMNQD